MKLELWTGRLALAAFTASVLTACDDGRPNLETARPELEARYKQLASATRAVDAEAYATLLADDFSLVVPDGTRLSRETQLGELKPSLVSYQKFEYRLGDMEAVPGGVWVHNEADALTTWDGIPYEIVEVGKDLWQKVNGEWMLAERRILERESGLEGSDKRLREVAQPEVSEATLQARREALEPLLQPISSTAMSAPAGDFGWLASLADGTRILGLGEGSHGTAEHFALKGRIFRELVEAHGYTVFLIEANFDDAYAIDRWVAGEGDQSAAEILKEYDYSVWRTQEMADLLGWMREYNAARGNRPMLRVAGIDMQDMQGSLMLLRRLAPEGSRVAERVQQTLSAQQNPSKAKAAAAQLQQEVDALPANTPDKPALQQLARTVTQSIASWGADWERYSDMRDKDMADNAVWTMTRLFPDGKAALWAHNLHVMKTSDGIQVPMGYHLAEELGPAYKVIGFSFGGGAIRAVRDKMADWHNRSSEVLRVPDAPAGSLDGLTASILDGGAPAAFLNVQEVAGEAVLSEWWAEPIGVAGQGGVYTEGLPTHLPVALPAAFDGIILTPTSSPAVLPGTSP